MQAGQTESVLDRRRGRGSACRRHSVRSGQLENDYRASGIRSRPLPSHSSRTQDSMASVPQKQTQAANPAPRRGHPGIVQTTSSTKSGTGERGEKESKETGQGSEEGWRRSGNDSALVVVFAAFSPCSSRLLLPSSLLFPSSPHPIPSRRLSSFPLLSIPSLPYLSLPHADGEEDLAVGSHGDYDERGDWRRGE